MILNSTASTMKKTPPLFVVLLILLPLLASCLEQKVYIVYLGEHSGEKTHDEIEQNHHSYLFSVKDSEEEAKASLIYSYKNSINGFAAVLTSHEASKLSELDDVVSVIPSKERKYSLQTTRSWEFVGLDAAIHGNGNGNGMRKDDDLWLKARYGKQIIVGMLDCGVWPESKSFNDKGMGAIPKSWKGICQTGHSFNSSHCNKKISGARYYLKGFEKLFGPLNSSADYRSPRDKNGHGSHTSSTVAGRRVHAKALGGLAHGTASGGAPLAHIAIYKVCWRIPYENQESEVICAAEDILAGIDDAIGDGVNVLSISLGLFEPTIYTLDPVAFGSLHAVKNNIVVSCAAGNSGPTPSTVLNAAPWLITVGASTVDRTFAAPILLGNGMKIQGETATPHKLKEKFYPLVYAAQVTNAHGVPKNLTGQCLPGSLSSEKVKGKIVMCLRGGNLTRIAKGLEVKRAGGVGLILGNTPEYGPEVEMDAHFLPATQVNPDNAFKILEYINNYTTSPIAYISPPKTVLHIKPAPQMAIFTSRGPNVLTPDILKPDITAPGVNILAAWSEGSSPSTIGFDKRRVKYNFFSGTSMACPHVSAAAALLKAIHPTWSTAAIRSALITTAGQKNNEGKVITDIYGNPANPFQYGAGQLRMSKAADPGLIYDASFADYLLFLCASDVNARKFYKCPKNLPKINDLNYPSVAISNLTGTVTVKRRVTNVGGNCRNAAYFASVQSPLGISVTLSPLVLSFNKVGEKKSFTITVKAERGAKEMMGKNEYAFGWYTWSDGIHNVTSPMAVSLA